MRELVRQVTVARQEVAQPREVGERGVRSEHEYHGGGDLHEPKVRPTAHQRRDELAEHGSRFRRVGHDRQLRREEADSEEERAEDSRHHQQGDAGVAIFRRLERGHAVGDRLRAAQAHRAGRERPEHE